MEWFRQGLREFGYIEGRTIAIDLRYAETAERLGALAAELVQSKVSVIATFGDLAPTVAQQATSAIPIVALADDFVGSGLVPNLARPGGNLTGVTILSPELSAKRLAVLKELIPKLSRVAALWDPANPSQKTAAEDAARSLSVKLLVLEVRRSEDLAEAFRAATNARAEALILGGHLKTGQSWTGQIRPVGERPEHECSTPVARKRARATWGGA